MSLIINFLIGFLLGIFVESQREDEPHIVALLGALGFIILTIPLQIAIHILI